MKTFKIKKSTAATTDVEATSPSKSSNIDNNSHNSLPVKQSIAIALASKLNKKNTTTLPVHDVELPKLIPIAAEPTCNPFREQLFNESLHPLSFEGDHFMPCSDASLLDASSIVEDVEDSILANAVVSFHTKLFMRQSCLLLKNDCFTLSGFAVKLFLFCVEHGTNDPLWN